MSTSTTSTTSAAVTITCPETGEVITLDRAPMLGEIIRCRHSDVELEVVGLDPVRVELAPEVEEDWGE